MLRVSKCFGSIEVVVVVRSMMLQVSIARVIRRYKGDVNSALRENSKEPSSSTVSAETSIDDDSDKVALNVYEVLPTITEKMRYKLYSNITCPSLKVQSLLRNVLNVKHHTL